jgi:hypothetical protein
MSLSHGPTVVTNGLAFYYDMSNTQKSWRGAPTTNLTPDMGISAVQSVTVTYVGIEDGWKKYSLNGTWTAGTYPYSISVDAVSFTGAVTYSTGVYIKTNVPGKFASLFTGMNYVNQPQNIAGTSFSIPQSDGSIYVGRYGFQYTSTTSQPGYLLSQPNVNQVFSSSTDFVYIKNGQIETSSFTTPYVNGTRSTTQALVDLTGRNTLTASSLTYESGGTFSFNGSSNYINLDNNIQAGYTSASYEFWCRPSALPGSGNYFQLYIQESSTWIALYNLGAGAFFGIDLNNGAGWFDSNGGSNTGARTTATLAANTYYHVAYSWNGSAVSVYLNGNLQATVSTLQAVNGRQNVTQLGAGGTPRNIGSRGNGTANNWIGTIDNARFYNRALSAVEVQQNFNALRGRYGL